MHRAASATPTPNASTTRPVSCARLPRADPPCKDPANEHKADAESPTITLGAPDYSAQTSCVNTAHPALGPDTDGTVSAAKGDRWECTITNTRKTATITLTKALAPAGDPGRFNGACAVSGGDVRG